MCCKPQCAVTTGGLIDWGQAPSLCNLDPEGLSQPCPHYVHPHPVPPRGQCCKKKGEQILKMTWAKGKAHKQGAAEGWFSLTPTLQPLPLVLSCSHLLSSPSHCSLLPTPSPFLVPLSPHPCALSLCPRISGAPGLLVECMQRCSGTWSCMVCKSCHFQ